MLDEERNNIFVHIDKKVENFNFLQFSNICKKSSLYFTKKRLNVKWGDFSQVKNEIQLYETVFKKGKYKYYHLLSGVDLPLKSQNEIHYLLKDDKEYIYFKKHPSVWDYQHLSRFHMSKNINQTISCYFSILQNKLKIDRFSRYKLTFYKGYNWCSLTHEAVIYLLQHEFIIYRMCRYSVCADECYKQIILLNSSFKDKISIESADRQKDLRKVDWINRVGDSPHIYTMTDFEKLKNSNYLFARKFDENVDFEIVEKIKNHIQNRG